MIIALVISILFSLAVGILAARNKRAESVLIPLLDVFQSIPILGFFPIVIFGIIAVFPGQVQVGVNIGVIFLIFTSMSWNIAFGVYEAVKSIPQDYVDLSQIANTGSWRRIASLYIPASLSRVAYNAQTSWAVGLFYLISSEILSVGPTPIQVQHGIGVDIVNFADAKDWTGYVYSIAVLIAAVVVWQFVFLREFSLWSERYKFVEESRSARKDTLLKFYSWVTGRSISKLFLLTQGKGVTTFTSTLYRFRRGFKYALLIFLALVAVLEAAAVARSAPSAVASGVPSLAKLASDEAYILFSLAFSFVRVWYVYFITVLIGLPLGIVISLNNRLYDTMVPLLEAIASIPGPALLPALAILIPNQGELIAAIIIFLGMIWYIIFNVMAGIRTLPSQLWELRSAFHISEYRAWRDIYLPATVTAFVTGSITAVGAAWNTLIVAEYFAPNGATPITQVVFGIGKVLVQATNGADFAEITLAILSMTALIVIFNLTVWRRVYNHTTRRYAYNR